MSCSTNERKEFRCCIASENSAGKLKIGSRQYDVCVVDTSRTGFRIRIPSGVANKLGGRRVPVLSFSGEEWEVVLKSRYSDNSQYTELGLARVRELTRIREPSSWGLSFLPKSNLQNDPTFLAFLVFAFLTAAVSLPGIGDNLGTAPKVRDLLQSVISWMR